MNRTKLAGIGFSTIALLLLVGFHVFGLHLIEDAYYERSISFVNDALEGRAEHSLESYQFRASGLVHTTAVIFLVISCGFFCWTFFTQQVRIAIGQRPAKPIGWWFLFTLLALDAVLIVLHVTHVQAGIPSSRIFAIDVDGGLPEILQYAKEFLAALLLFIVANRHTCQVCRVWGALFAYFLIDDSAQFHERLGAVVSDTLGLAPTAGFRPQDLGELTVTIIIGVMFFVLISRAHYIAGQRDRARSWILFFSVAIFAFFGVVTDMAHVLLPQRHYYFALVLIEDAGEMIVMSFIAWIVLNIYYSEQRADRNSASRGGRDT
jgi:hypothetical protein